MKKRDDLQALRAFAITIVLLFHFYPSIFPNGFLGVDQFFVLSGFLMAMIMNEKPINPSSIIDFYMRRIKRIVPLYAAFLAIATIVLILFFPPSFTMVNMQSLRHSVLFLKNVLSISSEGSYFIQLSQAEDLFSHCWSLGVEMQFYILVPLLFYVYQKMEQLYPDYRILYWAAIGLTSFFYSSHANKNTAFYSVFCRLWQFCYGITSFYEQERMIFENRANKNEDVEHRVKMLSNLAIAILAIVVVVKLPVPEHVLRAIITFLTGFIIVRIALNYHCAEHRVKMLSKSAIPIMAIVVVVKLPVPEHVLRAVITFLTGFIIVAGGLGNRSDSYKKCEKNTSSYRAVDKFSREKLWRYIVHLGDISYALYLVHWPFYVWVKFSFPESFIAKSIAFLLCFPMSSAVHTYFEKRYLKWNATKVMAFTTFFYLIIVFCMTFGGVFVAWRTTPSIHIDGPFLDYDFTPDEAYAINYEFQLNEYSNLIAGNCYPNDTEHGYCEFKDPAQRGRFRMLIIGNSYAANQAQVIHKHFKTLASNFSKFSHSSCEPWTPLNPSIDCKQQYEETLEIVQNFEPDILFVISRSLIMNMKLDDVEMKNDKIFKKAHKTLKMLKKLVSKRIYMLFPIPEVHWTYMVRLLNHIKGNAKFEIDPENQAYINGYDRMMALLESCSKCRALDFTPYFLDDQGQPIFFNQNTKVSYFTSGSHLTPAGLELIEPALKYEALRLASDIENPSFFNGKLDGYEEGEKDEEFDDFSELSQQDLETLSRRKEAEASRRDKDEIESINEAIGKPFVENDLIPNFPPVGEYLRQNLTKADVIRLNFLFDHFEAQTFVLRSCFPLLETHGRCDYKQSTLTGELSFFITGNSYAVNHADLIHKNFKEYANSMGKLSVSYCSALIAVDTQKCGLQFDLHFNVVKRYDPDVLFIVDRHIELPAVNGSISDDIIFQKAHQRLQKFENLTSIKWIFILGAVPEVDYNYMDRLLELMTSGKNFTSKDLNMKQRYENTLLRYKELEKRCTKCILYNMESLFDQEGSPIFFNEKTKLSYFASGAHLTYAGLEVIQEDYSKLANRFDKEYKRIVNSI